MLEEDSSPSSARGSRSPANPFRRILGGGKQAAPAAAAAAAEDGVRGSSPLVSRPSVLAAAGAISDSGASSADTKAIDNQASARLEARLERIEGSMAKALAELRLDLVDVLKHSEATRREESAEQRAATDDKFYDIGNRLETIVARIGQGSGENWMSGMR